MYSNLGCAYPASSAQARFDITLDPARLVFFPLKRRYLVEDRQWPRFTLALQSIASIFLALEGLQDGIVPDVWIGQSSWAELAGSGRALESAGSVAARVASGQGG